MNARLVTLLALLISPRAMAADSEPPSIAHVRVTRAPEGRPIVLRARFTDESEVFAPSVYVRHQGEKPYVNLPMKRTTNGFEAVIPGEQVSGALEYFVEVFDEHGHGPARDGTPEDPIVIEVGPGIPLEGSGAVPPRLVPKDEQAAGVTPALVGSAPEDEGVVETWWFWTILGAAVVGGVATAVLLTRQGEPLDFVDVQVGAPDPAEGLP